jgi:hypothetical protein
MKLRESSSTQRLFHLCKPLSGIRNHLQRNGPAIPAGFAWTVENHDTGLTFDNTFACEFARATPLGDFDVNSL